VNVVYLGQPVNAIDLGIELVPGQTYSGATAEWLLANLPNVVRRCDDSGAVHRICPVPVDRRGIGDAH